jgi:hypothetical protein
MPALFRSQPPLALVERYLLACGVKGLGDGVWFTKQHMQLDILSELFIELEPYYVPCKAVEYLHGTLTSSRAITVLRHILRVHGAQLQSIEKSRGGQKGMWYHVQSCQQTSMEVTFD